MGIDPGLVALVCILAAVSIWVLWPVEDDQSPPRKPPNAPGGSA